MISHTFLVTKKGTKLLSLVSEIRKRRCHVGGRVGAIRLCFSRSIRNIGIAVWTERDRSAGSYNEGTCNAHAIALVSALLPPFPPFLSSRREGNAMTGKRRKRERERGRDAFLTNAARWIYVAVYHAARWKRKPPGKGVRGSSHADTLRPPSPLILCYYSWNTGPRRW